MDSELTDNPSPIQPAPRRGISKGSIIIIIVGVLFLATGIAITAWALQTALDARKLNANAVRTQAQVRDWQISEQRTNRSTSRTHQVRYSFKVKGNDTAYRAEDDIFMFDQDDVWVEVPERVWQTSRDTGRIAIEYLKSDPSLNQPVSARRGNGSAIIFGSIGLVCLLIGFVFVRGGIRRPQKPV